MTLFLDYGEVVVKSNNMAAMCMNSGGKNDSPKEGFFLHFFQYPAFPSLDYP